MAETHVSKYDFLKLAAKIEEKSKPTRRDEEHAQITYYVNMFLGKFGKEGCMLAGSTAERTRVRMNRDEADSDFLLICGKAIIPTSCLVYNKDCPCFVSIRGKGLLEYFNVSLVDGEYLPAGLLRDVRPEAFSLLRIIFKALTRTVHAVGDDTPRDMLPRQAKVGIEMREYQGANMYDRRTPPSNFTSTTLNTRERKVADFFKTICGILMNLKDPKRSQELIQKNIPLLIQMFIPGQLDLINGQDDIEHVTQKVEDEMNLSEDIPVQFQSFNSKDYVPCFRLSHPPEGFLSWIYRDRHWPRNEVVDDIAKSDFFLVAKPALVNSRPEMDFCLSFTVAEKKLFDEVYKNPLQRKCYLVVKAMHKADLKYQNILRTFHWKTAFFWVCEKQRTWTEENFPTAVSDILNMMVKCLKERNLMHFFIKSNLFAGLENEELKPEIDELILKINQMISDPTAALQRFVTLAEMSTNDVIPISADEVRRAKVAKREKADSVGGRRLHEIVKQVANEVKEASTSGQTSSADGQSRYNSETVVNALFDVAKQVGEDARNKRSILTSLEKPLFSKKEGELISRAAALDSAKSTDSQVKDLSKDIAEFLVPRKMEEIELD